MLLLIFHSRQLTIQVCTSMHGRHSEWTCHDPGSPLRRRNTKRQQTWRDFCDHFVWGIRNQNGFHWKKCKPPFQSFQNLTSQLESAKRVPQSLSSLSKTLRVSSTKELSPWSSWSKAAQQFDKDLMAETKYEIIEKKWVRCQSCFVFIWELKWSNNTNNFL